MAKPFPEPETLSPQTGKLLEILNRSDDLTCALVGVAFLDHCLASLLQNYFADCGTSIEILGSSQCLGPLSARRKVCYSLGLISNSLAIDITNLGDIRNIFGHQFFDITFDSEKVSSLCKKLSASGTLELIEKNNNSEFSPRDRFKITLILAVDRILLSGLSTEHRQPFGS